MGFEKIVLNVVSDTIGDINANFVNGTLFIDCRSPYDAAKIETALIDSLKCGVIVSSVGYEFAFDFV
jgi:hypothetical protein